MNLLFYHAIIENLLILVAHAVYVVFGLKFKDNTNKVYSVPPLQPDPHQAPPEEGAPRHLALRGLHFPDPAEARGLWIASGSVPSRERHR